MGSKEGVGNKEKCIHIGPKDKCIPYQLQRLFLQLQTVDKRAVETTDVTKSFGWDSSEGIAISLCCALTLTVLTDLPGDIL